MKSFVSALLLPALVLTSCAKLGGGKKKPEGPSSPFGSTGIPPWLRAGGSGRTSENGTAATPPPPEKLNLTPEEDIIFTNPDNPEENLPELSQVLASAPTRRGPWEQSETIARQRASREGKALLIWFTDSQSSPMCRALSQELFDRQDFSEWANEKLVRLKIDDNVEATEFVKDPNISLGEKESRMVDARNYVIKIKKRFKVLGKPTLVLLNPGGEVVWRSSGYKRGEADFTWGLIKQGEVASSHAYQQWREKLEKRGYREWSDRRDRKVFAKLISYSKGTLILIEPDGTRCKTHENQLSDADRDWIAQQKNLRSR